MSESVREERPTGYRFEGTNLGLVVTPYLSIPEIVLEVSRKGNTRHTITMKRKRGGQLDDVILHNSGDLSSENFRNKITEEAERALEGIELEEEFSVRLKRIAAEAPKEFEARFEAAKEDKEQRTGERLADTDYAAAPSGFMKVIPQENRPDIITRLTNWVGQIVKDTITDDGAETVRSFTIEATFNGRTYVFEVPAASFESMSWLVTNLGAKAVCFPNQKEHARVCMQLYSPETEIERVYAHTGWRNIDGIWCYLHAGGAIAAPVGSLFGDRGQPFSQNGQSSDHGFSDKQATPPGVGSVDSLLRGEGVRLTGKHASRSLRVPVKNEQEQKAVRNSLDIRNVGPKRVTYPIIASVGRAPLGITDFTKFYTGKTGVGKTALTALAQQHFGALMDERKMLSWESTANSLEIELHSLKDQIAVIDDYVPTGVGRHQTAQQRTAQRILQEKGNLASRQRLYSDLTQRAERPPRAYMIATGEEVPTGQSLRGRMFITHMSKKDGNSELDFDKLTELQTAARKGALAMAMGGYVRWLAGNYDTLADDVRRLRDDFRGRAATILSPGHHQRTPGIVADLCVGLYYFLSYAVYCGAIDQGQANEIWDEGCEALFDGAEDQKKYQGDAEPVQRFASLIGAALSSGAAHIRNPETEDGVPDDVFAGPANIFGWERPEGSDYWQAKGENIGYVHEEKIYLLPDVALKVATRMSMDSAEPFSRTRQAMSADLLEGGHVIEKDGGERGGTKRRKFSRVDRKAYWVVSPEFLGEVWVENTGHTDHGGESLIGKAKNRGQWTAHEEVKTALEEPKD